MQAVSDLKRNKQCFVPMTNSIFVSVRGFRNWDMCSSKEQNIVEMNKTTLRIYFWTLFGMKLETLIRTLQQMVL